VKLSVVTERGEDDGGVAHGARLLAFVDAVQGCDDDAIERERAALRSVVSPEAFVDVCALVASFNVVDRVADATGIPLDPMLYAMSGDIREELHLGRFRSAGNTPGAR
jgi:hypothetical protein